MKETISSAESEQWHLQLQDFMSNNVKLWASLFVKSKEGKGGRCYDPIMRRNIKIGH